MNRTALLLVAALSCALLATACARKDESALERAADKTKDALDVRDHEALRDAAEDVKDAAKDLGLAAKDAGQELGHDARDLGKEIGHAAKDAAHDVKGAVKK